jgi:hypothetical protein
MTFFSSRADEFANERMMVAGLLGDTRSGAAQ